MKQPRVAVVNHNFIQKLLLWSLAFLLPTQLAYHLWPDFSYIWGLRIDYLSPTIYLTDLIIILLIITDVFWTRHIVTNVINIVKRNKTLTIVGLVILVVNIAISMSWEVSGIKVLKLIELILLGIYLGGIGEKVWVSYLEKPLLLSVFYTVPIGFLEFVTGSTTKLFSILGERSFSMSTPGIALMSIDGRDYLRAYSVFPHPNVFAGYLLILLSFLVTTRNRNSRLYYPTLLFIGAGLIISLSKSVFLLTLVVASFFVVKKYLVPTRIRGLKFLSIILATLSIFLLYIVTKVNLTNIPENISNRMILIDASRRIISDNFLFGRGLGTFIVASKDYVRDINLLQPVHNIYLLIFSEIGIVGLTGFSLFIFRVMEKHVTLTSLLPVCIILFLGTVDHYFITLQQSQLLFVFIISSLKTYRKM